MTDRNVPFISSLAQALDKTMPTMTVIATERSESIKMQYFAVWFLRAF